MSLTRYWKRISRFSQPLALVPLIRLPQAENSSEVERIESHPVRRHRLSLP